jgi:hypothetical protein
MSQLVYKVLEVEESQITVNKCVRAYLKWRILRMILWDLNLLLILSGLLLLNYISTISRFFINYKLIAWLLMLFHFFKIFIFSHLLLLVYYNLFLSLYHLSLCNFWESKSNRLKIEFGSTTMKIRWDDNYYLSSVIKKHLDIWVWIK